MQLAGEAKFRGGAAKGKWEGVRKEVGCEHAAAGLYFDCLEQSKLLPWESGGRSDGGIIIMIWLATAGHE